MNDRHNHVSYVLITPVRNEEAYIEKTIRSVISQSVLPCKWVIVDDASTDCTVDIVHRFIGKYDWMQLVRLSKHDERNFACKVRCFNAGYERVRHLPYEVVGNLDADVSFDKDYFQFLLDRFRDDPTLGVAGTVFKEEGYSSDLDSFEGQRHVPGQCQLFRRECFEEIGGYVPHKAGGVDWIAVTTARMIGWKTQSFQEKSFFHHRPLGTAGRSVVSSAFCYGEKDYYLGGHPIWELCRVAYTMSKRPYLIKGIALGLGYFLAFIRRPNRPVSREFVKFHRTEQVAKLKKIAASLLKLKTIDPFRVMAD